MDSDTRKRITQPFLKTNAVEVEVTVNAAWQVKPVIELVEKVLGVGPTDSMLEIVVLVTPYTRISDRKLAQAQKELMGEGLEFTFSRPEDESSIEPPEAA